MKELEALLEKLGGLVPIVGPKLLPVTIAEKQSIEQMIEHPLPTSYATFLLTYGESTFPEIVEFHPKVPLPRTISDDGSGDFGYFLGASNKAYGERLSLARAIGVYRDRMPDSIIPIAECSGNKICIGIAGKTRGKIYYWDHHNEWDEEDYFEDYGRKMPAKLKFQNLHLIADSFEDFIKRLHLAENA